MKYVAMLVIGYLVSGCNSESSGIDLTGSGAGTAAQAPAADTPQADPAPSGASSPTPTATPTAPASPPVPSPVPTVTATPSPTPTTTPTSQPPVINPISSQSISQGSTLTLTPVYSDPNPNSTLTLSMNNPLPDNSSFDGTHFSFSPDYTQSGQFQVVFNVSNGTLTTSESVTITVNIDYQAPVMASIPSQTVAETSTLSFSVSASQTNGDSLVYSASNLPSGASFTNNQFSWTPACNTEGTYQPIFTATDPASGLVDTKTPNITVTYTDCYAPAYGDQPSQLPSITGISNNELTIYAGSGYDYDIGDTLTYGYVVDYDCNNKAWTVAWNPTTRSLSVTNIYGYFDPGPHIFVVSVTDSGGRSGYRLLEVMGYGGSFSMSYFDATSSNLAGFCTGPIYSH